MIYPETGEYYSAISFFGHTAANQNIYLYNEVHLKSGFSWSYSDRFDITQPLKLFQLL